MKWKKFTISCDAEAEDLISGMLMELGYDSIEIEDHRPVSPEESGGLFGDVVPEMPEDDHEAFLSFYTEGDADSREVIARIEEGLNEIRTFAEIGSGIITESSTEEEDWINNWKEHFHSFRVDDILIEPTWEAGETDPGEASLVLRIDPGIAFGTGAHESTQLAIRAIRRLIMPGDALLDIGTGSGILGIVALKSGGSRVFGTDLDPNTLPAIEENLRENEVEDAQFFRVIGNIADDPELRQEAGFEAYDLVTANIIAEILEEITPFVPAHLKEGGYYITSGILHEKEDLVLRAAEKAGLSFVEIDRMGEWSGIVFRKERGKDAELPHDCPV